mmetsp:Transcript_24578/g.46183  ORF Transcript_24578/g.46183 Transcript_24578/m.46183 type:complete len:418 (+) Transcript_24578:7246-8499(+)
MNLVHDIGVDLIRLVVELVAQVHPLTRRGRIEIEGGLVVEQVVGDDVPVLVGHVVRVQQHHIVGIIVAVHVPRRVRSDKFGLIAVLQSVPVEFQYLGLFGHAPVPVTNQRGHVVDHADVVRPESIACPRLGPVLVAHGQVQSRGAPPHGKGGVQARVEGGRVGQIILRVDQIQRIVVKVVLPYLGRSSIAVAVYAPLELVGEAQIFTGEDVVLGVINNTHADVSLGLLNLVNLRYYCRVVVDSCGPLGLELVAQLKVVAGVDRREGEGGVAIPAHGYYAVRRFFNLRPFEGIDRAGVILPHPVSLILKGSNAVTPKYKMLRDVHHRNVAGTGGGVDLRDEAQVKLRGGVRLKVFRRESVAHRQVGGVHCERLIVTYISGSSKGKGKIYGVASMHRYVTFLAIIWPTGVGLQFSRCFN